MNPKKDVPGASSPDLLIPPLSAIDWPPFGGTVQRPVFDPITTAFSWSNAWWLTEASLLAYHEPDAAVPLFAAAGFRAAAFSALESYQAYVIDDDRFIAIVFRGTELGNLSLEQLRDWRANSQVGLDAYPEFPGRVHRGFARGALALHTDMKNYVSELVAQLERPLWLTGHSQGGALATLSAALWPDCHAVYTVGAPRAADETFTTAFQTQLWRICNQGDPVSRVPFELGTDYEHAGTSVWVSSPDNVVLCREPPEPLFFVNLLDHAPSAYSAIAWNHA